MQNSAHRNIEIAIAIASASLQPFTYQQWSTNQQYIINTVNTGNSLVFLLCLKTYMLLLQSQLVLIFLVAVGVFYNA